MAIINVILIQSITGVVSDYVYDQFWTMKASDDALVVLSEADCEFTETCPISDLVVDNTYDWYVIMYLSHCFSPFKVSVTFILIKIVFLPQSGFEKRLLYLNYQSIFIRAAVHF